MTWILRNLIITSLLTVGIFYFIFYSETGELPVFSKSWEGLALALIFGNIGGAALFYLNKRLNILLSWNKKRALRFAAELILGIVIFSFLAFLFYLMIISPNLTLEGENTFLTLYWDGIVKFGILLLVLLYLYSLVNFSMYSYNQYAVVQIESLSLERDQLNLKFEALKSQLSPHFLFNSLNTISSLTYRNIGEAEKYIRNLAATFTYLLKTEGKKLVSLKDEIEMVDSFFYMQQMKFGDCIFLDIKLSPPILETKIPPLTIQMLVENALKHNLLCKEIDLKIEIFERNDRIIVQNNLIEKPVLLRVGNETIKRPKEHSSHKIGLNNIRKRYHFFTNKEIEIHRNDFFAVSLPQIGSDFE